MSTSYGAPIELFSVDPASGAETELADASITNLLAELPSAGDGSERREPRPAIGG